jgi:RimJ/RimL family protein N-acetyltransferase
MTLHLPTIETDRLLLRPFQISDSSQVMALAGDRLVYETTFNIPHPYEAGVAEEWIASLAAQFHQEKGVTFAITIKRDLALIGAIGLGATPSHGRAELGYWIGVPYWNQGYCSEAAGETTLNRDGLTPPFNQLYYLF